MSDQTTDKEQTTGFRTKEKQTPYPQNSNTPKHGISNKPSAAVSLTRAFDKLISHFLHDVRMQPPDW